MAQAHALLFWKMMSYGKELHHTYFSSLLTPNQLCNMIISKYQCIFITFGWFLPFLPFWQVGGASRGSRAFGGECPHAHPPVPYHWFWTFTFIAVSSWILYLLFQFTCLHVNMTILVTFSVWQYGFLWNFVQLIVYRLRHYAYHH